MSLQPGSLLAGRAQMAANFGWLMLDRTGRVVVGVVVGVLVARHLGPEDFGMLSFAAALIGIFGVLASLGLEDVLVRDGARQGSRDNVWQAALQLRLAAAALAYGGAIAVACWWRPESPRTWGIVAIMGVGLLFAPVDLVDVWFQAQAQVRTPALTRQFALWIAAGWRLVLVARDAGLEAFAIASAAETALVAALLVWIFRRAPGRPGKTAAGAQASLDAQRRRLLREGWPLLASGLLVTITMQADRLLLARYWNDGAVGVYAAGVRLSEVFHALPVAFGAAVMFRLTVLRAENEAEYWRLARVSVVGLGLAGVVCAAAIALFAPTIVPWIFGVSYAPAVEILRVHAWSLSFVFIVSLRSRMLVIEAGTRWVLWMALLTAAINVAGNLWLIPRHGGVGAAWAAVVAWGFSALVAPCLFSVSRETMRNTLRGGRAIGGRLS